MALRSPLLHGRLGRLHKTHRGPSLRRAHGGFAFRQGLEGAALAGPARLAAPARGRPLVPRKKPKPFGLSPLHGAGPGVPGPPVPLGARLLFVPYLCPGIRPRLPLAARPATGPSRRRLDRGRSLAVGEGAARPFVQPAPGAVRGHVRRASRARARAHHVPLDGLFRALCAADPAVRALVPGGRDPRPREIPSAGRPAAAGGCRPGFPGPHRAACKRNQFAEAARGDQALLPDAGLDTA